MQVDELDVKKVMIDDINFFDIAHYRKSNSEYHVGDFVYYSGIPSYMRFMCIQGGTTLDGTPEFSSVSDEDIVTDGSVKWRVEDLRHRPFVNSDVPVGAVEWQYFVKNNYLALNGQSLEQASVGYSELLAFARDKELIGTSEQYEENKLLFKYDEVNDILTVPDFIGLVLQGKMPIGEIKAGLPNIKGGDTGNNRTTSSTGLTEDGAFSYYKFFNGALVTNSQNDWQLSSFKFDASKYNDIYGKSDTVQPPAAGLIPQIKYRNPNIIEQNLAVYNDTPIGTIIQIMSKTAPKDYLICDGNLYNINDKILLAEHIKREFGSYNYFGGDGVTTFAVPDLRGEFLRGSGTNSHSGQGSGANVGVHQDGTELSMIWNYRNSTIAVDVGNAASDEDWISPNYDALHVTPSPRRSMDLGIQTRDATGRLMISRPTNTSVLYCIKYTAAIVPKSVDDWKEVTTEQIESLFI